MEIFCYTHFSRSFFRPDCNGEVSVLWEAAPFSDFLVGCERIRGVFFALFGSQFFHETPQNGAPTRSCTELTRLPSECITENALRASKLASLTGFAPVISWMRGRRVGWTTLQGRNKLQAPRSKL